MYEMPYSASFVPLKVLYLCVSKIFRANFGVDRLKIGIRLIPLHICPRQTSVVNFGIVEGDCVRKALKSDDKFFVWHEVSSAHSGFSVDHHRLLLKSAKAVASELSIPFDVKPRLLCANNA